MDIEPTEEEILSEASFIEMKAYVKYCLYFGYSKQEITSALKNAGWKDNEISKAFAAVSEKRNITPQSVKREEILPPSPNQAPPVSLVSEEIEAPKPSS